MKMLVHDMFGKSSVPYPIKIKFKQMARTHTMKTAVRTSSDSALAMKPSRIWYLMRNAETCPKLLCKAV